MASIQVRNVPPDVHAVLKERAAAAGMSLSEYLLDQLMQIAEQPTVAELMERVRTRQLFELEVPSADLIREDRESR